MSITYANLIALSSGLFNALVIVSLVYIRVSPLPSLTNLCAATVIVGLLPLQKALRAQMGQLKVA